MSDEHEEREERVRIDVYHHFETPLEVKITNAAGEAVSFHLVPQPPVNNPSKENQ